MATKQNEILDYRLMKPGDIILTRDKRAFFSFVIRFFTWSRYSHAAIYVGDTTVCESVTTGVYTKNIVRWSNGLKGNCEVRRFSNDQIARMAASNSTTYLGTRYGYMDAIWSGISRWFYIALKLPTANSHIFCSRLVAEAYAMAGTQLCSINPKKVRPKDIKRAATLTTIDIPFIPQPQLETIDFTLKFENAVYALAKQFIFVLRKYKIKTNRLVGIATILYILDEEKNKSLDKDISNAFLESDYFNLKDEEMKANPRNWNANVYINDPQDANLMSKFQSLIAFHQRKMLQHTEEIKNQKLIHSFTGETYQAFIMLQEDLIKNSQDAKASFENGLNYLLAH